ncbi:MAG: hypothetical protein HRU28_02665 [Rhizobiales bacterium]|nr:hypothetical protein [Hyphomicrobiales bacterium]
MFNFMSKNYLSIFSTTLVSLSLLSSLTFAENLKFPPKFKNCKEASYMSTNWHKSILNKTQKTQDIPNIASKKLICKMGKEANIFVEHKSNILIYKLKNHLNRTVSPTSADMCEVVNNYCQR